MITTRLTLFLFLVHFFPAEELDRETRGLDSQGFAGLIKIGKLISNFGVENLEANFNQIWHLISKNVEIFYYMLIGLAFINALIFLMICLSMHIFQIKIKTAQNNFQHSIQHENTHQLETTDSSLDYLPAYLE